MTKILWNRICCIFVKLKFLKMDNHIYNLEIEKIKSVLLYIVNRIDNADLLKVFKILYFAEQKHLNIYGNPIVSDNYIAMKNGPVPSAIYDLFKEVRGDKQKVDKNNTFYNAFSISEKANVFAKETEDLEYLSKSNVICIDSSICENKNLTFNELSEKSHDSAWNSAEKDNEMNFIEIAKAGGANDEMLKYISECLSHKELISA